MKTKPISATKNFHPAIRAIKRALESQYTDGTGLINSMRRDKELRIKVSKELVSRALAFLGLLLPKLEMRGIKIEPIDSLNRPNAHHILVNGEEIKCLLIEEIQRVARADDDENKHSAFYRRWEWKRTGSLRFELDEYTGSNQGKRWSDTKNKSLEQQIDAIVEGFFACEKALKIQHEKHLAWQRKWEAERQAKQEADARIAREKANRERLEQQAGLWRRSRELTEFICECESRLSREQMDDAAKNQWTAQWLTWAKEHANQLDPFQNGYLEGEHKTWLKSYSAYTQVI